MNPLSFIPRKVNWRLGLALLLVISAGAAIAIDRGGSSTVSERGFSLGDLEIRRSGAVLLVLEVEIADTDKVRSAGLMGVERLDASSGMAFTWEGPQRAGFWMKNTLIPLDIAFWDEQARIVDLFGMDPCRRDPCRIYQPEHAYVGAVEMNQGLLETTRIQPGDEVSLKPRCRTDCRPVR